MLQEISREEAGEVYAQVRRAPVQSPRYNEERYKTVRCAIEIFGAISLGAVMLMLPWKDSLSTEQKTIWTAVAGSCFGIALVAFCANEYMLRLRYNQVATAVSR